MRRSSKQSSVVAAAPIPLSALPPSLSTTPKPSGSSSSSSSSSSLSKRRIAGSPTMMSNGNSTNGSTITNTNGFGHVHRTSTSSSTSFFSSSRRRSLSDPFNRVLEPPLNESPSARETRLRKEQAAKARSDDIDEQIKREKAALKRQKQAIKILLLGQSESGKSTTLKQFQLLHSPAAFHQERMAWRVVIYLNLIRSVRRILDALIPPLPSAPSLPGNGTTTAIPTTAPLSPSHTQTFSSSRYNNHNNNYNNNNGDFDYEYDTLDNDTLDVFAYDSTLAGYTTSYSFASTSRSAGNPSSSNTYANGSSSSSSNSRASPGPSGATSGGGGGGENASALQARFERYAKTLAPLFALELRLMRQLSFPDEEDDPVTGIPDYASEYAMSTPPSSTPTPTPFSSLPSSSSSPPKAKSPSSPSQPWWWNSSTATSPPPLTHLTIPPSSFGGVMSGTGMGGDGSNSNSNYGFSSSLPFAPPSHASASSSSSNSPISPHPYQTASSPTLHTKASTSFTSAASSSTAVGSGSNLPPLPPISAPIPIPLPIPVPPLSPTSAGGELTLRTSQNWKKTFSLSTTKADRRAPKSAHTGELAGWWEDPSDPVHIVHHCAYAEGGGMIALWRDRDVRRVLERKRVRMEESSGFYLNEIERIAGRMYIPQDDDILRARLKTLGVVEHTFTIKGSERSPEWKVYDVGGARSQRQAWAPYFEDVNAIIFLAPISAFDQTLAEDARVNRLEDSMLLWRSVVSNKLLTRVSIILFLNKIDLLRSKLEAGVQLSYHMPSYGQRKNDYNSVSEYFRHKFKALHTHHTPNPERDVWIHLTSVTDKQKTHIIIANGTSRAPSCICFSLYIQLRLHPFLLSILRASCSYPLPRFRFPLSHSLLRFFNFFILPARVHARALVTTEPTVLTKTQTYSNSFLQCET
ncbi:G-alpha-domain-containing protein [Schizopora paradoxa]|uniref:G-alpha-domain-containing protein n=1 Tax=Schizopora paradoxa TaxID=27342 RepID=A0A0H2R9F3_9AGAM|nr:G-alpha-domain-containing protein [Schizopora paradoxa]